MKTKSKQMPLKNAPVGKMLLRLEQVIPGNKFYFVKTGPHSFYAYYPQTSQGPEFSDRLKFWVFENDLVEVTDETVIPFPNENEE